MCIWLSQGSEGVPEQDNEIACQVIWFENSSHPELVCGLISQEFAKTHYFLSCSTLYIVSAGYVRQDVLRRTRVGGPRRGPRWQRVTEAQHQIEFSISQLFRAQLEKCPAARQTAHWPPFLPADRSCLLQNLMASVPSEVCGVGIWILAPEKGSTWTPWPR